MRHSYFIGRELGEPLLLSPFDDPKQVVAWDEETPVSIGCSSDLGDSERESVQYRLYRAIDNAVDAWIQELKYIPRLINSALAFLAAYFFFSFVVRDPLPVLDELLLAFGAAAAVYIWTASKNRKSLLAVKRRTELKNLVDRCTWELDEGLSVYEGLLRRYDQADPLALAEMIASSEAQHEQAALPGSSTEILSYLELLLQRSDREAQMLKRINDLPEQAAKREQFAARLLSLSRNRKIDLPLLALYKTLSS